MENNNIKNEIKTKLKKVGFREMNEFGKGSLGYLQKKKMIVTVIYAGGDWLEIIQEYREGGLSRKHVGNFDTNDIKDFYRVYNEFRGIAEEWLNEGLTKRG